MQLNGTQRAKLRDLMDAYVATKGPDRYRDAINYDEIEAKSDNAAQALIDYVQSLDPEPEKPSSNDLDRINQQIRQSRGPGGWL